MEPPKAPRASAGTGRPWLCGDFSGSKHASFTPSAPSVQVGGCQAADAARDLGDSWNDRKLQSGGPPQPPPPPESPKDIWFRNAWTNVQKARPGIERACAFDDNACHLFWLVEINNLDQSEVIALLDEIAEAYMDDHTEKVYRALVGVDGARRASAPTIPTSEALEPLTHVPGLVGDLIDWITMTARRPNRILALGAALTIVGTLIGRRVATPTRSGTHLYVVTLAPTGAGKQHALNCISRAMKAARAAHHLGPGEFMSMSAVVNTLQRQPLSLCPMDEFGAFLKRINNPRKSSQHEAAISKILRSSWGTSFEDLTTPEWAGRKSEVICTPALSIYGLSTPDEFYESLQGEDIRNGFLNRFLVLSSGTRVAETTPETEAGRLPQSLAACLQELYQWGGSLGIARLNDPTLDPDPDVLPWTEAAKSAYADLAKTIEHEMDTKPELEPFIARAAEIGVRLATIRAVGRSGHGASVELADVEWGREVAMVSARMVAAAATAKMIIEMSAGKMSAKITDVLRRAGGRATRRDVMRALGRSIRKTAEVNDVAAVLQEQGLITVSKSVPTGGGPPTVWYELAP
jgi:hypothetical protein